MCYHMVTLRHMITSHSMVALHHVLPYGNISFYGNTYIYVFPINTSTPISYTFQGSYAGEALGFRLSSLLKLLEEKSNQPQVKLIHVIAEFADKHKETILNFPDTLGKVAEVVNLRLAFFEFPALFVLKFFSE